MTDHTARTPVHLDQHHRDTAARILTHPSSGNVEWHAVVSLLGAIADVEHRHDGKLKVSVGGDTVVLTRPRGKDLSTQQLVDLRSLLSAAGLGSITEHGHEA